MFEVTELHNERHGDGIISHPNSSTLQVKERRQGEKKKTKLELTVPSETILPLFPTREKTHYLASESYD